jgi:anaerobic magnesium-protoporphyrin IX monomethyl ester cyclase
MMVTLISVYETASAYGLRLLSAVLTQAGFETRLVFLPRETEGLPWDGFRYPYPQAVLDQLTELAVESDLVGISLTTNYFYNAAQITQHLRRSTSAKIVWGGIHPTVRPEECLEYADFVCVGEGEEALLELAHRLKDGGGHDGIDSVWYRQDEQIVRTPLRPPPTNLDAYPFPDYGLANSFVLHQGQIQPLNLELLYYYSRRLGRSDGVATYETVMTRGCSYSCTYCCNNALRAIYRGKWRIRRRSVENVISELEHVVARFPGFSLVQFNDDEFLSEMETVRAFSSAYPQAVDIPFVVVGFQPPMVDRERIALLVDAGMKTLHMGIQTGSMNTMRRLYHRPVRREQILQATQVLASFADRLDPPAFDLILDNPWETDEDQLETLSLLLKIPRPYQLQIFSLTLYPGTELYERGRREGLLHDEMSQVFEKHYVLEHERTYINCLFELVQSQRAPRWLMKLLMHDNLRKRNWVWLPCSVHSVLRLVELVELGWQSMLRGNWGRITRYLRLCFSQRPDRYKSLP